MLFKKELYLLCFFQNILQLHGNNHHNFIPWKSFKFFQTLNRSGEWPEHEAVNLGYSKLWPKDQSRMKEQTTRQISDFIAQRETGFGHCGWGRSLGFDGYAWSQSFWRWPVATLQHRYCTKFSLSWAKLDVKASTGQARACYSVGT